MARHYHQRKENIRFAAGRLAREEPSKESEELRDDFGRGNEVEVDEHVQRSLCPRQSRSPT
ncbi:hypothetical protein VP1G_10668 [Cytospora mali]|uniref:Uncharacterized protein n=1 Tax=Cytospora mali TaxID=578113 RepID=A0A194US49_CYTMA|nr:hypothetical protein VP1G_10668 [Valsa mali var. pyri (nom. inval.)]